jgi:hypothetical protein
MAWKLPRINYRVYTVFVIVSLPVLALGAMLVLGIGQVQLRASYERGLAQTAEHVAAAADAYVFRRILDTALLARTSDVREQAAAGSREPVDPGAVGQLDRAWRQERRVPPAVAAVLTNRAARFLADVVRHDPIYREILLTDREGRLVAASNVTSDYY